MRITILCVSKRPREWVSAAANDYLKRLTGQLDVVVREVAPIKRSSRSDQLDKEADRLRRCCPRGAYQIALDERGEHWSTKDLAVNLDKWRSECANVVFFIGGAEGLAPSIVAGADRHWSLSQLTLPHQLVRVIVIEQLYRGWGILHNHPYHRA